MISSSFVTIAPVDRHVQPQNRRMAKYAALMVSKRDRLIKDVTRYLMFVFVTLFIVPLRLVC